ncbi:MAG: alpha-galactosidase [Anaerolineae bacterium]|nr:alpha-galactosidase [Anaerolineae bacterium]
MTSTHQIVIAPSLTINLSQAPRAFYCHGWQSWSLATWLPPTSLPIQQPTILHPMQTDPRYARVSQPHGSWVGAVELVDGEILLLGALNTDAHIHLNENRLEGWYESGEGEWLIARGDELTVFAHYAQALGQRFGWVSAKPAPRVWCSWYGLYTAIDETILCRVFDGLNDLPFDVLQVDDGWQRQVGDWQANAKFPSGMAALADTIKNTGRKAGLWLAPFIAVQSSRLFREHPTWFLRDEHGRFVSAGFNWGERLYALDVTRPDVLDWLTELMKQVRAWGYDYLKLDFLYAGALPGKRYVEMPREVAYRRALSVLRKAMGDDAFFLACGAPILPSLGLCDGLRIGPDVASEWEVYRDAVLLRNLTTPGVRNAIRTCLHRLWLVPLVQTDPDVVYFASKWNTLSRPQKQLLQELALICNFKATSDVPQWWTREERAALRDFLLALPKVQRLSRAEFRVEDRVVDFSEALGLPALPEGKEKIVAAFFGWLGNQPLVLKALKVQDDLALRKRRESLGSDKKRGY